MYNRKEEEEEGNRFRSIRGCLPTILRLLVRSTNCAPFLCGGASSSSSEGDADSTLCRHSRQRRRVLCIVDDEEELEEEVVLVVDWLLGIFLKGSQGQKLVLTSVSGNYLRWSRTPSREVHAVVQSTCPPSRSLAAVGMEQIRITSIGLSHQKPICSIASNLI